MTEISDKLLLCTDLDRTLLPNGEQPESEDARRLFHEIVSNNNIWLAYVSGRDRQLVIDAINEYDLPVPDFAICDVGASIYDLRADHAQAGAKQPWRKMIAWQTHIAADWCQQSHADLALLFSDIDGLSLQETSKQNRFKLSYYVALDAAQADIEAQLCHRLRVQRIKASLIWSIDEQANVRLLDVLPESATKLSAIEFIQLQLGVTHHNTLFAGDSGNDSHVLLSHIPSVLVANASSDVREAVRQGVEKAGTREAIYFAQGGFLGMNGNYSAGILEGIAHYYPALVKTPEPLTGCTEA
jgi:HAD superfamily hydrolase (TIGR01484 family)